MEYSLGLDIGYKNTKLIVLSKDKKKTIVKSAFSFPTPFKEEKTDICNIDENKIIEQLINSLPQEVINKADIAVSLPSESITGLSISLPAMPLADLKTAAIVEAKRKMIPTPGPDSEFSFTVINDIKSKDKQSVEKNNLINIFLIKVEREFISKNLYIVNKLSSTIRPVFLGPSFLSLPLIVPDNINLTVEDIAFIDLGYSALSVAIFKNKQITFYRKIPFGIKDVIEQISQQLECSIKEAESLINSQGLPRVSEEKDRVQIAEEIMRLKYEGRDKEKLLELELYISWQDQLKRIIHEIRRTFSFYNQSSNGRRVKHIAFLGGGIIIPSFFEHLQNNIGGNCFILSLPNGIEFMPDFPKNQFNSNLPIYLPAFSLAYATSQALKPNTINFLPADIIKKRILLKWLKIFSVFSFILLIVSLSITVFLFNSYQKINRTELSQTAQINEIAAIKNRLDQLHRQEQQINDISTLISRLDRKQKVAWSKYLYLIAKSVPQGVLLNKLEIGEVIDSSNLKTPNNQSMQMSEPINNDMNNNLGQNTSVNNFSETKVSSKGIPVKITASFFGSYEQAKKIANDFIESLKSTAIFEDNIELALPQLEHIDLNNVTDNKYLTPVNWRQLQITATLKVD